MKLQKRGRRNRGFLILEIPIAGFFYEGQYYEGFEHEYGIDHHKTENMLLNIMKTTKAFKRWLRVNPYNAPKGTEFILKGIYVNHVLRGKIK